MSAMPPLALASRTFSWLIASRHVKPKHYHKLGRTTISDDSKTDNASSFDTLLVNK
jgi:hypothetical protein